MILSVLLSWVAIGVFMACRNSATDGFPALLDKSD
jgi:hypothetical protein